MRSPHRRGHDFLVEAAAQLETRHKPLMPATIASTRPTRCSAACGNFAPWLPVGVSAPHRAPLQMHDGRSAAAWRILTMSPIPRTGQLPCT